MFTRLDDNESCYNKSFCVLSELRFVTFIAYLMERF